MDDALVSLAHEIIYTYDNLKPDLEPDERGFLYEAGTQDVDAFFEACRLVIGMHFKEVLQQILMDNDELCPKLLEAARDSFYTDYERKQAADNLQETALALRLLEQNMQSLFPSLYEQSQASASNAEKYAHMAQIAVSKLP